MIVFFVGLGWFLGFDWRWRKFVCMTCVVGHFATGPASNRWSRTRIMSKPAGYVAMAGGKRFACTPAIPGEFPALPGAFRKGQLL